MGLHIVAGLRAGIQGPFYYDFTCNLNLMESSYDCHPYFVIEKRLLENIAQLCCSMCNIFFLIFRQSDKQKWKYTKTSFPACLNIGKIVNETVGSYRMQKATYICYIY